MSVTFWPISCYWPLLNPLKISENLWFSDVFQGVMKWVYRVLCSLKSVFQISKLAFNLLFVLKKPFPKMSFVKRTENAFFPAGIYLLKVNNRNTGIRCEICPKLTIRTPERRLLIPQDKTYPQWSAASAKESLFWCLYC